MRAVRRFAATILLVLSFSSSPAWAASAASPQPASHHAASRSSGGREAGEIVGFVGLVGLLVAWSEGYGLLGGRNRRQAQLPARGADKPEA